MVQWSQEDGGCNRDGVAMARRCSGKGIGVVSGHSHREWPSLWVTMLRVFLVVGVCDHTGAVVGGSSRDDVVMNIGGCRGGGCGC